MAAPLFRGRHLFSRPYYALAQEAKIQYNLSKISIESFAYYKWVVNPSSRSTLPTLREIAFNSRSWRRFLQHINLSKASLNNGILKLYMSGFTRELPKCRTFTIEITVREKQSQQNSFMAYTENAGSQKISDTATTI